MNRRGSWVHILGAIAGTVFLALLGAVFEILLSNSGIFSPHTVNVALCANDHQSCEMLRAAALTADPTDDTFQVISECVPYKDAGTYEYVEQRKASDAADPQRCDLVT